MYYDKADGLAQKGIERISEYELERTGHRLGIKLARIIVAIKGAELEILPIIVCATLKALEISVERERI